MTREEMIIEIYHTLWISAEFENDFYNEWKDAYSHFWRGTLRCLPDWVIECCYKWMEEWMTG